MRMENGELKMKNWLALAALLLSMTSYGRTVTTGTIVANPGATVSVPVTIDDISDMGAAVVTVGYDSTVLVCLGVDVGGLTTAKEMTYLDSGDGRLCAVFSGFSGVRTAERSETAEGRAPALPSLTNELMHIRFSVRDGTQGLFSDVTLLDVQCGAKDGVSDLSVANPLKIVNGMVRVMASDAAVTKLEENFIVWPKTTLKTLTLSEGDGIMASADMTAIRVSQSATASAVIPVVAPLGGWQSGSYALLTTPTDGLSFVIEGASNVLYRTTVSSGLTTYWADITIEGEVVIEPSGEGEIAAETKAQIKSLIADDLAAHPEVKTVTVAGDSTQIPVIVDLGIAPQLNILGTTAPAPYTQPSITITEFNPDTGAVRIKVNPGAGNSIKTTLATGCIHVYGTSDLSQKMRYISGTSIDLTPYLQTETKGEADLTVSLGTHTFIKIKAETLIKQEGEQE